ncbi:hypothetical protein Asppvi_008454 [Aspergillus pseudoviridinutans]|uniref:Uncharacterized protein n=1 Tax=Aspergillus pseudoviridinutans TaxID=1517512 RepID=A0A9P3EXF1_9EURO|nr:uncharacterized protein Asppvi_008454 [Aspergillus pseudoviridinutans]GIJ89512.1 hypothetical protein Asppvi_008454 [Aspergillus pseudoviridinutans]
MSPYHVDHVSQSIEHETWENNSDYVPTPGYCVSPYAAPSALRPSPSSVRENSVDPKSKRGPHPLRFLPLHEWEEGRVYDEDPPACIHYRVEWRVTINNREVSMDTEEDVVLAPSAFWQLSLARKLEKALRRKTTSHRRVRPDDTVIVASISDRTKRKLTKRFDDTDITWSAIEKQLLTWSDLFSKGKELTLKISFNYVDDHQFSQSTGRKGEKRGKSSVTQRMLGERDAQLDAEEHTSGEKPIWRSVYNLVRCDSSTCPNGPHCWVDPMGKKHDPLRSHHIKRLITHVEKGGVVEGHKDVPEAVRDELYREEQERQERQGKDKRKGGHVVGTGPPYPCNIINVLPSQSAADGLDVSAPKAVVEPTAISPLEIPGPRDVAVKEYGEWQISNVENDTLKSAFRQVCDVMLDNGLDLEQVCRDQDPKFFIEKGIKIGIARRFVEDIGKWAEQVKKVIPLCEIL